MSTEPASIPDGFREMMEENNWTEEERDAWRVLHEARPGDLVLWADRKVAMEVVDRDQNDDGQHVLEVDKPQGEGTYTVTEKYHHGNPKFTSPIGRANNIHFVERTEPPRGLSEEDYDQLVARLSENAQDAFMRMDYSDWADAVEDVVTDWADMVSFLDWKGYKHHPDWREDDPEAIFESVLEHGDYREYPENASLKEQAKVVLHESVFRYGRQTAEENLISSADDYREVVETLAHHSIDRYDRKNYDSARHAVRDTISDWIDDRASPAHQSVINYGEDRFDDSDYTGLSAEETERERAFDILDHDVWEEVQHHQRDRGEHDPTIRGLTYADHAELVDWLAGNVLREYDGDGLLRTTVEREVKEWADSVEREEWGGHRHRVYADGDVDDIFASVAIHADNDPSVWNPFSRDKERKLAELALVPDVKNTAANIIDERGEDGEIHDADDFVQRELGLEDTTYDELHEASSAEVREFLESAVSQAEGDEVGWTFVEEIVEAGGTVPESTTDWTLMDYGVVREGEDIRRLAWFDQESGAVLILSGIADADYEGLPVWDEESPFHVQRIENGSNEPEYLLSDVVLEEALDFVYDYIDAEHADVRLIEDGDDVYVEEAISDDDINAHGVLDALVPNINLRADDVTTVTKAATRGAGKFLDKYWFEITGIAALAAVYKTGRWSLATVPLATNLRPSIHKDKGVGVKASKDIGRGKRDAGVGGEVKTGLYVRNQTFAALAEKHTPRFIRYGFNEGDIGKGALASFGQSMERVRGTLKYNYEDDAVPKIRNTNLDDLSHRELKDLANETDRGYSKEAWNDKNTLRQKVYGYAEHYEPEERSWGDAFLDQYAGSVERLEQIFWRGTEEELEELEEMDTAQTEMASMTAQDEMQDAVEDETEIVDAANVADVGDDVAEMVGDSGQKQRAPAEGYIAETRTDEAVNEDPIEGEFSWSDLRHTRAGISGLFLRGLEAEDVVAGAQYLNVEKWLGKKYDSAVQKGSEYVQGSRPTFEEWQEKFFGPGEPSGPEEEARRRARYYREVAGAGDPPDPLADTEYEGELGEISDERDAQGDYNNAAYDFDDSFGNDFDEVAERYADSSPPEERDAGGDSE